MPRADLLPFFTDRDQRGAVDDEPARHARRQRGRHHAGLAAVVNAIVDALAEFGVEHIELPATPERVWRAIRAASGAPGG